MAREAFDIQGLDDVLARLQALPKEVSQKAGGPVRKVLRKAANIIRDEAKANVRKIIAEPNKGGDDESTGLLEKSITVLRGKPHRTLNGERMLVLVPKRRRYPISERTPSGIPVSIVGRMLEYGYDVVKRGKKYKREPMKWMAPAFHAKKMEAVATVVRELPKEIDKAVERLAKRGR